MAKPQCHEKTINVCFADERKYAQSLMKRCEEQNSCMLNIIFLLCIKSSRNTTNIVFSKVTPISFEKPKRASIHAKLHTVQSIKMVTFFREGKCQKKKEDSFLPGGCTTKVEL